MVFRIQSIVPLVLTPVVLWLIFNIGSDKTVTLIIPWFVFCALYLVVFRWLARSFRSGVALAIVVTGISVLAVYAVSILLLYLVLGAMTVKEQ